MPTTAPTRAAIYVKEAAGYPEARTPRNFKHQSARTSALPKEFEITTRYYDPPRSRHQFDWMMGVSGRAGVKPRCVVPNWPSLQEFADNRTMRRMQGAISNEGTT